MNEYIKRSTDVLKISVGGSQCIKERQLISVDNLNLYLKKKRIEIYNSVYYRYSYYNRFQFRITG